MSERMPVRHVVTALVAIVLLAGAVGCGGETDGPDGVGLTSSPENDDRVETATVGPTEGDESTGARVHIEMSGDGYTADYDAWNCDGIEGDWRIEGELVIEGYGTISGGGSFYIPPRPADGPWESEPFSYSMEGTLDMGDAVTDILYEFEDVVFTIIDLEDGPTLGDSRGTAKGTVRVTTPEMSMVVAETYSPMTIAPALIRFERHPSCE